MKLLNMNFVTNINHDLTLIDKNIRFVISSAVMTALMLFSTFFFFDKAIIFLPLLALTSYIFAYFALLEDIEKIEWLMLFIMPVIFSLVFYLFYFLLPIRWLTRLPLITIYGISYYAILRTANIFNVGVEKSLQLYRAAFSINFFYHAVVVFCFSNFLFSLKLNPYFNGLIIFVSGIIMATHLFWTIRLNLHLEKENWRFGLLTALVLAELTISVSFMAFEVSILALLVTVTYYCLTGLTYSYLDERLFKETVREYIFVLSFVFFIALLTWLRW